MRMRERMEIEEERETRPKEGVPQYRSEVRSLEAG
jgi:hypothetical protein